MAQTNINFKTNLAFFEDRISDFNELLWNAALEGKIDAYANDSFTSKASNMQILDMAADIHSIEIENGLERMHTDNDSNIGLLVEKIEISSLEKLYDEIELGLCYEIELKNGFIGYTLQGIALQTDVVLGEGIEVSSYPLFWVKFEDLSVVLNADEMKFYSALFAVRASIGDFMGAYSSKEDTISDIAENLEYTLLEKDKLHQSFEVRHDSIIAMYYAKVIPHACALHYENTGDFFKDASLLNVHKNLDLVLTYEEVYPVSNPDFPEDPYDIVMMTVRQKIDIRTIDSVQYFKQDKRHIFSLTIPNFSSDAADMMFVNYEDIKQYISSMDQVLIRNLISDQSN